MIAYMTLGATDRDRAIAFYDNALATLGIERAPDWSDDYMGWGVPYRQGLSLWICSPWDGRAPHPGNGTMIAFRADTKQQVHDFHAAALAHGGTDEGPPGKRPNFGPRFYACYVRDPDGNKLACVWAPLTGEPEY